MCEITCHGAKEWTQSPIWTFRAAILRRSSGSNFRALFMFYLWLLASGHTSRTRMVAGGAGYATSTGNPIHGAAMRGHVTN